MATVTSPKPVLESGDRLTQPEFHRRYCQRPDIRAELVEGVVYLSSPVRVIHGGPHADVVTWLGTYAARHPELTLTNDATAILDPDNEVQPDAALWREEPGGPRVNAEGYLEGAPQLVAEVAASSASYDLHDKLRAYRRNGVREYIIWRVMDGAIDWFRLHEGEFLRIEPDAEGRIESAVFPGLRLNIPRILARDMVGVLADLER